MKEEGQAKTSEILKKSVYSMFLDDKMIKNRTNFRGKEEALHRLNIVKIFTNIKSETR